jgi:hypothetical protein
MCVTGPLSTGPDIIGFTSGTLHPQMIAEVLEELPCGGLIVLRCQ